GSAARPFEKATQRGREEVGLDVPTLERVQQNLEPFRRVQGAIEEDDLFPAQPARTATDPVTDVAQQDLLANGQAHPLRQLLRLLAERLGAPTHSWFLSDGMRIARALPAACAPVCRGGLRPAGRRCYRPVRTARRDDQEHPGGARRLAARRRGAA